MAGNVLVYGTLEFKDELSDKEMWAFVAVILREGYVCDVDRELWEYLVFVIPAGADEIPAILRRLKRNLRKIGLAFRMTASEYQTTEKRYEFTS